MTGIGMVSPVRVPSRGIEMLDLSRCDASMNATALNRTT